MGDTASMTSGQSTMLPTSPVCPPPSDPWQMMKSRPAALWLSACLTEPARAPIIRPAPCTFSTTSGGGVPRALAMSLTLGWRRATSISPAAWAAVHPIIPLERPLVLGDLGHAVVGQDLEGELLVLGGDQAADLGLELVGVHLVHALVLGRDDDVDAVGPVADVLVDPGELHLELLGGEGDGPEDADAPGVGHGGHHVAAVGEGEDGELDAEPVADLGVHGVVSCLVGWWSGRTDRGTVPVGADGRRGAAVGSPTRAARPRRARSSRHGVGVESLLHGQSGEQGPDQHGQLLGVGWRVGRRRRRSSRRGGGRCSAGPRRCAPGRRRPPRGRGRPAATARARAGATGTSRVRRCRTRWPTPRPAGPAGESLTATSASRTVRTESFHESRRARRRPCLEPKWA